MRGQSEQDMLGQFRRKREVGCFPDAWRGDTWSEGTRTCLLLGSTGKLGRQDKNGTGSEERNTRGQNELSRKIAASSSKS